MNEHDKDVRGLIFNIQDYAVNDGPGIRTVVFLKGCPLRCQWCANPEGQEHFVEIMHSELLCKRCGRCVSACPTGATLDAGGYPHLNRELCRQCKEHACEKACLSRALKIAGTYWTVEELFRRVQTNAIYFRNSGGGVTLSGGEPLAQPEFVRQFIARTEAVGLSVGVETSGMFEWARVEDFIGKMDFYFYDVKCLDPEIHQTATGVKNERILQNLRLLAQLDPEKITVSLAVIPGVNDSSAMALGLANLCKELQISKVRLLPYHTMGAGKYADLGREYLLQDGLEVEQTKLLRMEEIIRTAGISCWIE